MKTIKFVAILFTISLLTQSCGEPKYPIQIGENYFVHYDHLGLTIIMDTNNAIIMSSEIVAWNFDSTFIIAKQKPVDSISEIIKSKYSNLPLDRWKKIYAEIELYSYWIIDKRKELKFYYECKKAEDTSIANGPFTEEEYWKMKRELNIPDSFYIGKKLRYTNAVNGPFTYEQYWEKRRELRVPDSLQLLEAEKTSFPGPIHCLFYKWFYSPPARERVVE
jgi:hypothetical protein